MLISDAVENYLIHLEAMGRAQRTIQSARERLAYFQTFSQEREVVTLDALTPELVDLYIVSMRRKELSPVTVAGRQQALKAFLAWCVKRGLYEEVADGGEYIPQVFGVEFAVEKESRKEQPVLHPLFGAHGLQEVEGRFRAPNYIRGSS